MKSILKNPSNITKKETLLIKSLIKNVIEKIKNETIEIEKNFNEYQNEFIKDASYLKKLENDITILQSKLNLKKNNDNNEVKQNIKKESIDYDLKKIYKLIASKCHPDKTNNLKLQEYFIYATNAYNTFSYTELLDIYKTILDIDNEPDYINISDEERLTLLKKELVIKNSEFENLTKTNGYIILNLKRKNQIYRSRKFFIDIIYDRIFELEELKQQLEENLNSRR